MKYYAEYRIRGRFRSLFGRDIIESDSLAKATEKAVENAEKITNTLDDKVVYVNTVTWVRSPSSGGTH